MRNQGPFGNASHQTSIERITAVDHNKSKLANIDLYIHVVLRGDALCIIHLGGWRGINGGGGVATRASHAGRGRGAPPLYVDSDVCRAFVDGFNVVGEHIYV